MDGPVTESGMEAEPERPCASAIVTGSVFGPGVVASGTVAAKVNVPSPGVRSPCVPSSKSCWVAEPPIAVRSAVAASPVLAGFAPGVTATVRSVEPPGVTAAGAAAPVPDGLVGTVHGVAADTVLRGAGAAAAKSVPLASVSVQPFEARNAAVEFESVGAAADPSKKLAFP